MDRKVFMTFDDFVKINTDLLERTRLALYRSESYDHPFVHVGRIDTNAWQDSGLRALALMIGNPKDAPNILGPRQFDVKRPARVGFVNVEYGEDDVNTAKTTTTRWARRIMAQTVRLLKNW